VPQQMTVTLAHRPNPDIRGAYKGYWEPPVDKGAATKVEVADIDEASRAGLEFIDRNGLGGGNWLPPAGAVHVEDKLIGTIAYNGRFFPVSGG